MAYLGRKGAAAALNSADIPDNSITGAKIVAGTIEASDVAADMATQAELDLKAPLASPAFTGTPTGITAAHITSGILPVGVTGGSGLTALASGVTLTNPTLTGFHTYARLSTGAYGSTNSKIIHFSNTIETSNDTVVTVASTSAAGLSVTANVACLCWINFYFAGTGGDVTFGLSKNSTQLTTAIYLITSADNLGMDVTRADGQADQVSFVGALDVSDVIRPHADGNAIHGTGMRTQFHVLAIRNLG